MLMFFSRMVALMDNSIASTCDGMKRRCCRSLSESTSEGWARKLVKSASNSYLPNAECDMVIRTGSEAIG